MKFGFVNKFVLDWGASIWNNIARHAEVQSLGDLISIRNRAAELRRILDTLAVLSALTVAYFLMINGPVGSPKDRLPIEPILISWFGCGLLSFWKFVKKFRYRRTIC